MLVVFWPPRHRGRNQRGITQNKDWHNGRTEARSQELRRSLKNAEYICFCQDLSELVLRYEQGMEQVCQRASGSTLEIGYTHYRWTRDPSDQLLLNTVLGGCLSTLETHPL